MKLTNNEIKFCDEFIKTRGNLKQIALNLNISITTVRTYRAKIFVKLKINTSVELIYILLRTEEWRVPKW